jgi:hypothetical protein
MFSKFKYEEMDRFKNIRFIMQSSKILPVDRINKRSVHGPLLLLIIASITYITFINILLNPSYAKEIKLYGEIDKCQASNTNNDDTKPYTQNSGNCDRIIINSEKCDSFTSMILSFGSIKCS